MSFHKARIFGLGLLVAVLIAIGMIPTAIVIDLSDHDQRFYHSMEVSRLVSQLGDYFWRATLSFDRFMTHPKGNDPSIDKHISLALDHANALGTLLGKTIEPDYVTETADVLRLIDNLKTYRQAVKYYMQEVVYDPASDNVAQFESVATTAQKETIDILFRINQAVRTDIQQAHQETKDDIKFGQLVSFSGLSIGILIAIFISVILSKTLAKPLKALLKGTQRVADGDLNHLITCTDDDEIGKVTQAFNEMTRKLAFNMAQQKHLLHKANCAAESEEKKVKSLARLNTVLREEIRRRKVVEVELKRAKDLALSGSQAKSNFMAGMSHELRTPLNHIIGFTEMTADGRFGSLNEKQRKYLDYVLQSGEHLLSLVNDILDLAKVEAGKDELKLSPVNLEKLMKNSLTLVKEKAIKHRIKLSLKIANIPDTITVDERKLKQILFNLMSNAVKFTEDNGRVDLSAKSSKDGSHIEISVVDSGIGINHEHLTRIFAPFEQIDGSCARSYEGTGLGLSLSKKLVELHGGRIWAQSDGEGQGSRFSFSIPVFAN